MSNILMTMKKELRSFFRDKKTMIAMFIYPILIPCMVFLYGGIGDATDNSDKETYIGINYQVSEAEKTILEKLNIKYTEYKTEEEMHKAYKNKEINGYVTSNDNKEYMVYIDESSTDGMTTESMIISYLDTYNNYLTNVYLESNGINVEEARNQLKYDFKSLDSNNYMIAVLLSVSLTYTILSICIAASNMAISTTAQEKENGTLETILTFPISKEELITGKYGASVIVGFTSAIISLILMIISFLYGSKNYKIFEGISLNYSFASIATCVIVLLVASIFISGIAMFLTAGAKSYKEAQSKISFITLLGVVPMFIGLLEIEVTTWYYLIPICNFEQIINDLLLGSINYTNLLITVASSIIYTFIIIKTIIKLYNGEKILYSN